MQSCFAYAIIILVSLGVSPVRAQPMRISSNVRADARSGRLVRTETVAPKVVEAKAVSAGRGAVTASTAPPAAGTLREFKDNTERAYLVAKLRENGWNISKTAEVIDTPRSNLYKKLEQYQISQETDG